MGILLLEFVQVGHRLEQVILHGLLRAVRIPLVNLFRNLVMLVVQMAPIPVRRKRQVAGAVEMSLGLLQQVPGVELVAAGKPSLISS